jgi:hypothetical protein
VETGSRQENGSNQKSGAPFRFNRNGAPVIATPPIWMGYSLSDAHRVEELADLKLEPVAIAG